MSALKKFAGQTAIYGLSTVLSRVLNFLLTKLYVTQYPTQVYGIFTYMYSWASMLNAILAFGMETTFFRYLHKPGQDKEKVFSNTFTLIAAISVFFLGIAIFFSGDIAAWMQQGKATSVADYALYIKYFIFILVIDAVAVIPFAKVRAEERPLRYGLIKITNILVFIGLNLFFLLVIPLIIRKGWPLADFFSGWYRPQWIGYVFISNLVASGITLLLLLPELLTLKPQFDRKLVKEMLVYSFPVLIANLSFIINENSDKIFLNELLPPRISEREVGIYGACSKIAIFLSIFVQAFRLGAEPFFFSHASNKNAGHTYARIMDYFVIAVSLIFVALVANLEILKHFIGAKDPIQREIYWSGLKVVPILLLGYVSLGIYMNLSIWYKLSDQTRYGLYISGIGALVTIVLNVIFIPKYSYIASAWISLTAYATMMIISYILGQKKYPIPYNLPKNLTYLFSAALLVFLSFYVFNGNLIWGNLLLFLFAAATVFFERKELKLLFRAK